MPAGLHAAEGQIDVWLTSTRLTDLPAPAGYAAALAAQRPACRLRLWSPPLGGP